MLTFIFWVIIIAIIIILILLGFTVGGGLIWLIGDLVFLVLSIALFSKLFRRKKKDKKTKGSQK